MTLLIVFAFGSLVCCWIWGDVSTRTKCALSMLYIPSWGLLFIPFHAVYLFPLTQCVFAILVGGMTFGVDWIMRNAWHVR
jgi:hypothetical protein